jgi:hypothetical protein
MFPENLLKASLTHCLYFLWLGLSRFFLWCPIFAHFILFLPQISHSRCYHSHQQRKEADIPKMKVEETIEEKAVLFREAEKQENS